MKKLKTPLLFALAVLPVALVSGILVTLYQIDLYSEEMIAQIIAQIGSLDALVAVGAVQSALYGVICAFFGCILAQKLGLWKKLALERKPLATTAVLSLVFGILFSLDYWVFGTAYPAIQEGDLAGLTLVGVASSVLYGGIMEEIMLRLFFLTALAWIIWKLFFRNQDSVPTKALVIANVVAALAFAAGHLPATVTLFGGLQPILIFRCFLLNGGFGLFFGWLYRKYGISYAILSHALLHIISKLIWWIFI